jgi:hypothetical protein
LLTTAFVDEGVDARRQDGSVWNASYVEIKIGLIAFAGQCGRGGMTRIFLGRWQRKIH